jgi:hypothetical protein
MCTYTDDGTCNTSDSRDTGEPPSLSSFLISLLLLLLLLLLACQRHLPTSDTPSLKSFPTPLEWKSSKKKALFGFENDRILLEVGLYPLLCRFTSTGIPFGH